MPAKLISRSATQENIIKIQVRESKKPYPIYSNLEILKKKWFANLDCKVCSNGKVENERFRGFHPISYVNQSRRYDSHKKPSTFAST